MYNENNRINKYNIRRWQLLKKVKTMIILSNGHQIFFFLAYNESDVQSYVNNYEVNLYNNNHC